MYLAEIRRNWTTRPKSDLPQRHRLHLRHVLHARTRGRCKKTLVIQNSHSLLIRSAGKTPPTCDEIVDLRHSACGHNNAESLPVGGLDGERGSLLEAESESLEYLSQIRKKACSFIERSIAFDAVLNKEG